MSYNATATSKSMMTNEEAWDLTNRLREELQHPLHFAQALYQLGTPTEKDVLECLIGTSQHLRSEPMSDLETMTKRYMASTDQSMQGVQKAPKHTYRVNRAEKH